MLGCLAGQRSTTQGSVWFGIADVLSTPNIKSACTHMVLLPTEVGCAMYAAYQPKSSTRCAVADILRILLEHGLRGWAAGMQMCRPPPARSCLSLRLLDNCLLVNIHPSTSYELPSVTVVVQSVIIGPISYRLSWPAKRRQVRTWRPFGLQALLSVEDKRIGP